MCKSKSNKWPAETLALNGPPRTKWTALFCTSWSLCRSFLKICTKFLNRSWDVAEQVLEWWNDCLRVRYIFFIKKKQKKNAILDNTLSVSLVQVNSSSQVTSSSFTAWSCYKVIYFFLLFINYLLLLFSILNCNNKYWQKDTKAQVTHSPEPPAPPPTNISIILKKEN